MGDEYAMPPQYWTVLASVLYNINYGKHAQDGHKVT